MSPKRSSPRCAWHGRLLPCACPFLLAVSSTLLVLPAPASPQQASLPVLTRIEQVRSLPPQKAERGYPVRLRGVVTYYGGQGWELFIQDSTGGIYVNTRTQQLNLKAGDLVEVEGITQPGFLPEIISPRLRVLGQGRMPSPRRVSYRDLATGREDSQWVEIEGIVRSATERHGQLILEIVADGRFKAHLPPYQPEAASLVDAEVRVRGACGGLFNPKNQLLDVELFVPSLDYIDVQLHPIADPFALPLQPLHGLLQFRPEGFSGHRVKVQGTVTLQRLGRTLFIRDESQAIYVETQQMTAVRPGDRVDVVGFPSPGGYTPMLEDAIFRKVDFSSPPAPIPVTPSRRSGAITTASWRTSRPDGSIVRSAPTSRC